MACSQSKINLTANQSAPITHSDLDQRQGKTFIAKAANPVWVGGSDVTVANGYPKDVGEEFGLSDSEDTMYVICDVATTVNVFWAGV